MNEFINKFLLVGDKFMPEMHLRQPGFSYSACGPFTKNKERIEKLIPIGIMSSPVGIKICASLQELKV